MTKSNWAWCNLASVAVCAMGLSVNALADSWSATTTKSAPTARRSHTSLLAGTKIIVWGGGNGTAGSPGTCYNTGALYDPTANSWTAMSTKSAPTARWFTTSVFTGSKMIVFGGQDAALNNLNTGGSYDVAKNTWTAITTTNAPTPRRQPTSSYIGGKMFVWGGIDANVTTDKGGIYDPATNKWTATTLTNAPIPRYGHTQINTATEAVIYGGLEYQNGVLQGNGAKYNPATDTWTQLPTLSLPAGRFRHTAVYNGTDMIVYQGSDEFLTVVDDGFRYNPDTDSLTYIPMTGSPYDRERHSAVMVGSKMVVFGGYYNGAVVGGGGVYDPALDLWSAMTTTGAPSARYYHTAVGTATKMIVWGGSFGVSTSVTNTGGVYTP